MYDLIGGKAEKGETMPDAAVRETFEEIGITVQKEHLKFIHVLHSKHVDQLIGFCFVATQWSGEPFNKEPEKHDDLRWFSLDQLPPNIVPAHREAIKALTQEHYYSEYGL